MYNRGILTDAVHSDQQNWYTDILHISIRIGVVLLQMKSLFWIVCIVLQQHQQQQPAAEAAAPTEATTLIDYEAEHTFCGRQITSTLSGFCRGRYLTLQDLANHKVTYTPNNDGKSVAMARRGLDGGGPFLASVPYADDSNPSSSITRREQRDRL